MLFYENVYSVSREYNQRFELQYVPLSNKPSLIQRLLVVVQSVWAQRVSKPAQITSQTVRNTVA